MDFTKFDKKVDVEGLKKDVKEAEKNGGGDFPDIPKGQYEVKFESIEVKETKDGRPMLSAKAKILDGEYKKLCLWFNRVLFGTKNDANMISGAVSWLNKLGTDIDITFEGYNNFAELVMDVAEEVEKFEYIVDYDPKAFNSVSVKEVFEVE